MNSFQPKDDSTPHIIAPDVRDTWVGLSLAVTKADMSRALLEGAAYGAALLALGGGFFKCCSGTRNFAQKWGSDSAYS